MSNSIDIYDKKGKKLKKRNMKYLIIIITILIFNIHSVSQIYTRWGDALKEEKIVEKKKARTPEVSRIIYKYLYSIDTLRNGNYKNWRFNRDVEYLILLKSNKYNIELLKIMNSEFNKYLVGFIPYKGIEVEKTPILSIEVLNSSGMYSKKYEEYNILGKNSDEYITIVKNQEFFEATLIHEFGHAIGLSHSKSSNNVMFYKITGIRDYKLSETEMQLRIKNFCHRYSYDEFSYTE